MLYTRIIAADIDHIGRHGKKILFFPVLFPDIHFREAPPEEEAVIRDAQGHVCFKIRFVPDHIIQTVIQFSDAFSMRSQAGILQDQPVPIIRIRVGRVNRRIIPVLQFIHQNSKPLKRSVPVPVMVGSVEILPARFSVLRHIGSQIQRIHSFVRKKLKKMISGVILVVMERFRQKLSFQVFLYRGQHKEQRNILCLQEIGKLENGIRQIDFQRFIRCFGKGFAAIVQHSVVHEHGLIVCPASGHSCKKPVAVDKITSQPQFR